MTDLNRKLDELLEDKLRRTKLKTTDNFTSVLMKRVTEEQRTVLEEARRDKIAKFIVWGFIAATISIIFVTAFLTSSSEITDQEPSAFRISPGIETTSNLLTDMTGYLQSIAGSVLSIFGLNLTTETIFYICGFILIIGLYLLGDRLIIRSRLKSDQV